jgi:acetyl-CoA carboxylase biotin carboxyl carrier protein
MSAEGERERLLAALPALLREMAASGVTELDVSAGGASLYLKQRPGTLPPLEDSAAEGGAAGDGAAAGAIEEGLAAVNAPLAGVFYASPKPDEPPYVSPGDTVEAGQVVALVEAMKAFNEIHAEVAGTVEAILVENGQAVRAGQTLMSIRPDPSASTPDPAP